MQDHDTTEQMLTLSQAAQRAQCSVKTLRRAIAQGRLPRRYTTTKFGPQLIIDPAELQRWRAGHHAEPEDLVRTVADLDRALRAATAQEQPVFIYALSAPEAPAAIRYVGQTTRHVQFRVHGHVMSARTSSGSGQARNIWLREVLERGAIPVVRIMAITDRAHADAVEGEMIRTLRAAGHALTNGTGALPGSAEAELPAGQGTHTRAASPAATMIALWSAVSTLSSLMMRLQERLVMVEQDVTGLRCADLSRLQGLHVAADEDSGATMLLR